MEAEEASRAQVRNTAADIAMQPICARVDVRHQSRAGLGQPSWITTNAVWYACPFRGLRGQSVSKTAIAESRKGVGKSGPSFLLRGKELRRPVAASQVLSKPLSVWLLRSPKSS